VPPTDRSAVRLADAVRRVMEAAVLTGADEPTLSEIADELHAISARLAGDGLRDSMPWPDEESMRRGHRPYSPVIGAANPLAPPLVVRVLDDGSVVGECTMRPIHEGPPGVVHGGWVATLLDQLRGHANAAAGAGGFTAQLTIRYLRPTPYGVPLTVRARTDEVDGRRVFASGEIVANGEVTAEATGLFKMPSEQRVAELRETVQARAAD
jgi:acyl-coenzyme A thioesterase PaaI-like protein